MRRFVWASAQYTEEICFAQVFIHISIFSRPQFFQQQFHYVFPSQEYDEMATMAFIHGNRQMSICRIRRYLLSLRHSLTWLFLECTVYFYTLISIFVERGCLKIGFSCSIVDLLSWFIFRQSFMPKVIFKSFRLL